MTENRIERIRVSSSPDSLQDISVSYQDSRCLPEEVGWNTEYRRRIKNVYDKNVESYKMNNYYHFKHRVTSRVIYLKRLQNSRCRCCPDSVTSLLDLSHQLLPRLVYLTEQSCFSRKLSGKKVKVRSG